jgi:hypothetical protein
MNFRYTIGKALKNAIIGDIFIGQVPGSEKSVFRLKKDNFQWPMSPGVRLTLTRDSQTNGNYEPSTCPVYPLYGGPTHGPQIALEVNQLCPKISQICKEWKKFLRHVGYHLVTFFRRF